MLLEQQNQPLVLKEIPNPTLKSDELLVKVRVCGVCRTDLHVQEADLPHPKLPLILGHEVVGTVETIGKQVKGFQLGQRVGIPWLPKLAGSVPFAKKAKKISAIRPFIRGILSMEALQNTLFARPMRRSPFPTLLPMSKLPPCFARELSVTALIKKHALKKP